MRKIFIALIKNTVLTVFFFFCCINGTESASLTKSPQTIPEYHFQLGTGFEYVEGIGGVVIVGVGAGITSGSSLHLAVPTIMYLEDPSSKTPASGDISVAYKYLLYQNSDLLLSAESSIVIPSSRNMYKDEDYHHLTKGVDQVSQYIILQKLIGKVFVIGNMSYNMIADENEDFYSGFYINPVEKKTYQNVFGLNPFSDESFLSTDRLVNDWYSVSTAASSDVLYPFVFQVELYYSSYFDRLAKKDDPEVEGGYYKSVLAATALQWHISPSLLMGLDVQTMLYSSSGSSPLYLASVNTSVLF